MGRMKKEVSVIVTANFTPDTYRTTRPLWLVRLVAIAAIVVGLIGIAAFVLALSGAFRFGELAVLRQRNRQLETEFKKVGKLRADLERLEEQTRRMAALLGVGKTPPPVNWDSVPVDSAALPEWLKGKAWGSQPLPKLVPVDSYTVMPPTTAFREAVELAARSGSPVRATADGVVESRGEDRANGRSVLLKHAQGYESFYAHLEDWNVDKGDTVSAGQTIGWVGTTGKSTAPHLLFEIRKDGKRIDPATLIKY